MQGARQDLIMGLLLDPTNNEVLSTLSRLSVGDVISSRASDSAKIYLRNMLYPPVLIPKTTETVTRYVVFFLNLCYPALVLLEHVNCIDWITFCDILSLTETLLFLVLLTHDTCIALGTLL